MSPINGEQMHVNVIGPVWDGSDNCGHDVATDWDV